MAYSKQTWTDLAGTGLNKYTFNGVRSTMTWEPDSVTEAGTAVTASRMNHIEDGVYNATQTAESAVPSTRKVGGVALSSDVTLAQMGAVPTSRKVNGNTLTGDITVTRDQMSGIVKNGGSASANVSLSMSLSGTTLTITFA